MGVRSRILSGKANPPSAFRGMQLVTMGIVCFKKGTSLMTTSPPSMPGTFCDRSTGLMVYGILTILIGALCLLGALLIGLTVFLPQTGMPMRTTQTVLPGVITYLLAAIALVWLGIGSLKKRRWARALLLIGSWSGLVMGLMALIFMAISFPKIRESIQASIPDAPPAMQLIPLISMGVMMLLFYVILPGTWLLFYRSPNVKATCDYYDPVARWTDTCPLPVLAMVIWLCISIAGFFIMAFSNMTILPFFGTFIHGPSAIAASAILMLACIFTAGLVYRCDIRGWWIMIISVILFATSALITYSRHDLMEVYRLLNFPPEQLAAMEKFNFFQGNLLYLSVLIWVVPALAYLIYLKKFFKKRAS